MTMENVTSGFRTTGIYPINRAAVFIKTPDIHFILWEYLITISIQLHKTFSIL